MPEERSAALDSSRLPIGDDGWNRFLVWAGSVGVNDENDWVEIKGAVDPTSRVGGAKIAKYILGAANRHPDDAARHLGGHGVLLVGIGSNGRQGVPPPDLLEVQKKVNVYLGQDGPHWELKRFPAQDGDQVLAFVVDPPRWGDPIHVCAASGDGVEDGHIYYRPGGATRQAKSAEIAMLQRRAAAAAKPAPAISVTLVTPVAAYVYDIDAVLSKVTEIERELVSVLPSEIKKREEERAQRARREEQRRRQSAIGITSSGLDFVKDIGAVGINPSVLADITAASRAVTAGFGSSTDWLRGVTEIAEDRTEEQFREQVASYITRLTERVWEDACRDLIIRQLAPEFVIQVTNEGDEYIEEITVDVHIDGPIEALDSAPGQTAKYEQPLPRAPRAWGPRKRDMLGDRLIGVNARTVSASYTPSTSDPNTATARTTGSVNLTVNIEGLRARESVTVTGDEVLILRDHTVQSLEATWTARARNVTGVLEGNMPVGVEDPVDFTDEYAAAVTQSRKTGSLYIADAADDAADGSE